MNTHTEPKLIIALDFPSTNDALTLAKRLNPTNCHLKIGKELFTSGGPILIEQLQNRGFKIFLDLKFHDIPNTVAGACRAAAELGVWMLTVHALGGRRMLVAAREAIDRSNHAPLLIAVTVLTSHNQDELVELGLMQTPAQLALQLAQLSQSAGVDGVVCSAHEANQLSTHFGKNFRLVTPGIRPDSTSTSTTNDDQRRVMTPQQAIAAGAHYLVIGRPVTQASDPVTVIEQINQSISNNC